MKLFSEESQRIQVIKRFIRFGLVGGSGVLVDMGVLFILGDPSILGCNLSLSKALAAEMAILNNYIWNDLWTFHDISSSQPGWRVRAGRFAKFNLICAVGIVLNVLLLNGMVHLLGWNVYASNLVGILLVSLWNFGLNLKFAWGNAPTRQNLEVKIAVTK